MTRLAQADGITAVDGSPASAQDAGSGWPAMRLPITGDVTCKEPLEAGAAPFLEPEAALA
jgi:hypothetical protein